MKKFFYILTVTLAAACAEIKDGNPYEGGLNTLSINVLFPEGFENTPKDVIEAVIEDMNTGSRYSRTSDVDGKVTLSLPNGLYRINMSGKSEGGIFNGAADKVVLSDNDLSLDLALLYSKAGSIVIKELYCGGCKKLPEEGNYQADQYFILHNNHYEVQYLDSLCFG